MRYALAQDREFLDSIQLEMSTPGSLCWPCALRMKKTAKYSPESTTREKPCMTRASRRGAWAHRRSNGCWALYFEASMAGDQIPDVEGSENFDLTKLRGATL